MCPRSCTPPAAAAAAAWLEASSPASSSVRSLPLFCPSYYFSFGSPTAAAALLLLLLICAFLRRARRMRFRSRAAGAASPGRQIGFMYFPTPHEYRGGAGTTPGMAEHGAGATRGPAFPQPAAAPRAADEGVASPPPMYQKDGQFAPVR